MLNAGLSWVEGSGGGSSSIVVDVVGFNGFVLAAYKKIDDDARRCSFPSDLECDMVMMTQAEEG